MKFAIAVFVGLLTLGTAFEAALPAVSVKMNPEGFRATPPKAVEGWVVVNNHPANLYVTVQVFRDSVEISESQQPMRKDSVVLLFSFSNQSGIFSEPGRYWMLVTLHRKEGKNIAYRSLNHMIIVEPMGF